MKKYIILSLMGAVSLIGLGMAGCPSYCVYTAMMEGKAQLAHAQYSREVAVAEAKAKMEAADLLAKADISRAQGAAQANVILGNSLKGNEDYLRYVWIQNLEHATNNGTQVIYVPTEGGLPILEAGHRR